MSNAAQVTAERERTDRFSYALHIKAATDEQKKLRRRTFVASTPDVDSHGEIVEQSWNFDRYKKNPVVLWAHDRWALPLGKAIAFGVVGTQLEVEIEFAPASANPQADQVYQLVELDMVRAVSVGFWPNDVRTEMRNGEEVYVLSNNELYEISVLPIGSNPQALSKALARAVADRVPTATKEPNMSTIALDEHNKAIAAKDSAIADREGKLAAAEKALATERAEKAVIETARDKEKAARETAEKRVADLEREIVEKEVDAIVGEKITPAEKEEWLALRLSSKAIFDKQAAKLPKLGLTKSVSGDRDVDETGATGRTTGSEDDLSDVEKRVFG